MNIVEAYIKFNKGLIIVVSGISGCGKTTLARDIERDFNLKLIDQYDYYLEKYDNKTTLSTGEEIINWYDDNSIDWERFNNDINKSRDQGLIITGFSFPTEKIDFAIDNHIMITRPKNICLKIRQKYIDENRDKYTYEYEHPDFERIIFNKLEFPYFLSVQKRSNIDKFINAQSIDSSEVYDMAFDYLIESIQKNLSNNI
jgi:uridine kinase